MGAVPFQQYDAPFYGAVAITPADSVIAPPNGRPFRGLYVGGAGNVSVRMLDGTTVTFTAPPVGTVLNIQYDMVHAATTATLLIGLY